jgi:hypothetical protein
MYLATPISMRIQQRTDRNNPRKLSEILLEFLQEIRPTDPFDEDYFEWVDLTIMLWNIGCLPRATQGELLFRLSQKIEVLEDPHFNLTLADWLELRRNRYPDDRRVALEWDIVDSRETCTLKVLTMDLARLENESPEQAACAYQDVEEMILAL